MSEQEPTGPMVYQAFGDVGRRAKSGRLYGVCGLPAESCCEGFTKAEAEAIVEALRWLGRLAVKPR